MKTKLRVICLAMFSLSLGCIPAPQSGKGFTLPEGDTVIGEAVYLELQCHACHSIAGVEQQVVEGEESEVSVRLGGKVPRIQTYGELVTSIINPSHRLAKGYSTEFVAIDGESRMKNYNDVMTVTQLTHLVAFVQSKYEIEEYVPTDYNMYYGP